MIEDKENKENKVSEKEEKQREIFERLNKIDLTNEVDKKMNLTYLSWAKAWQILKNNYPSADYKIYKNLIKTEEEYIREDKDSGVKKITRTTYEQEIPYFTDGKTCFVRVGVTIDGIEYIEELPVMDNKNNAVRLEAVTSTLVNKSCYRAFVKACAKHGLGLYIYAGEDLPEDKKIDMKALIKEANMQKVSAEPKKDEDFNILKETLINKVLNEQSNPSWNENVTNELFNYISITAGKPLSQLSNNYQDISNITKILYLFQKLEEKNL